MTDSLTRRARATPRVTLRRDRAFWEPSATLRRAGFRGVALGPLTVAALNAADELNAAADARRPEPGDTVDGLLANYIASSAFGGLSPRTRRDRTRHLRALARTFGPRPADRLSAPELRRWHADMADRAPTDARSHLKSARAFFRWAVAGRRLRADPTAGIAAGPARRRQRVATRAELAAMIAALDAMGERHVASLALASCYLAQRQCDARALHGRHLEGGRFVIRQSKTGAVVRPRAHGAITARIGMAPPETLPLFPGPDGRAMAGHHAERAWRAARAAAARDLPSLEGRDADATDPEASGKLDLKDMRRTGMVWMALGGADVPAIVSVSGHRLDEGHAILEHYLPRTRALADLAIDRLPEAP